jgi:hypothetical protein
MSSDIIPLNVVYHRVEEPQEKESQNVVLVETQHHILEESDSSSSSTQISYTSEGKYQNGNLFYKLFACFGIFTAVVAIIWFIITLTATLKVARDFKQCFHSKHYELKESVITEKDIHRIDFNVITGYVNVEFYDKPEILIRIYDKYRSEDLIDIKSFSSKISFSKGLVSIVSESPAFNYFSCQHAQIEIFVPKNYPKLISFTGFVKTGAVYFHGERTISVGSVDIVVEAGYIKAKHINSQALSLSTEVGVIKVKDVLSSVAVKLNTVVGFIKSKEIVTKIFHANTKYGGSMHKYVIADNILIDTHWGYSSVIDTLSFDKVQNIDIKTGYGKSFLLLNNPHLNFTLTSKKGDRIVEYEDENYICNTISNINHPVLSGKCNNVHKNAPINKAIISMETEYGVSNLVVDDYEDSN